MTSALRTEHLDVTIEAPILRDVTIDIHAGDFVALMGANGTGKTTLVRTALGLMRPAAGKSWLWGQPSATFRDWHRVAYVPQHLFGNSTVPISVYEAVLSALASPSRRWRRHGHTSRATVMSALEAVGLQDSSHRRVESLSGGQQRRVMIGRALAIGADLLLMDEPTAGVDRAEQERLAGHFRTLQSTGKTIVLITHDLGPVAALADRAIVLGQPTTASVRYDGPSPPPERWTENVWHHSHEQGPAAGETLLEQP